MIQNNEVVSIEQVQNLMEITLHLFEQIIETNKIFQSQLLNLNDYIKNLNVNKDE